jgi:hypothetical protein
MAIKIQNQTVIDDGQNATLVSLELTGTGALKLPVGTTAQRPNPILPGHIRYNSELGRIEGYNISGEWGSVGGDSEEALALAIIGL